MPGGIAPVWAGRAAPVPETGGWPLCTEEGVARLKIAKSRKHWPSEHAPKNETRSECRMRRLTQEFEDTRLKMRIAGILNR